MASNLSELQWTLCLRMNTASVQLVGNTPWCSLCYRELPFKSQYNAHTFGYLHLKNSNSVFEILMDKYLSRGILLDDDGIYCMLCEEMIGHRFDWRFRQHVNDYSHRKKILVQHEYKHFDKFYEELFDLNVLEDLFAAKVSRAGILMDTSVGEMRCFPCGRTLLGEAQFKTHVNGASHKHHVKDQLINLFIYAGLDLGIVIKDGFYSCDLCDVEIGPVALSNIAEKVYDHIRPGSGLFETLHDQKKKKQLDDGLDTYYDTHDDTNDSSRSSSSSDDYSD